MKWIFILLFIGFSFLGISQSPKLINYQGLARDITGAPITSTNIALKFEIKQGGTVVFTETLSATTNSLGLFSTQIGSASGSNLGVNWQSGTYALQVGMDVTGTGNFVSIGPAQPLASVPYALHAASVPASYANSILTIGSNTIALPTSPTPTITGGGIASVSPTTGTSFVVSVPAPSLALASGSLLSVSGGNTITLPAGLPQSAVTGSGIVQITTAGTNSFNVNVPAPNLTLTNNSLSINNGNTVTFPQFLPQASLTAVSGIAVITTPGTNTFNINVPAPALSLNGTNLGISTGNTINISSAFPPTNVTATLPGLLQVTTVGSNTFNLTAPLPTYNGTVLTFGANTPINIAPTLLLSNGILTSGLSSNSVSINNIGPWKQTAPGSVSLTVSTDNISLGTPGAPSAKLDIRGTTTSTPVIRAINANPSNTAAVIDASTDGDLGLVVTNTSASGTGGKFFSQDGRALQAQSSSSNTTTFYSANTNTSPATYAGYFSGGFIAESKSPSATHFAVVAQSSTSVLFNVRGDGNVGINTTTPVEKLHVIGSVRIEDGLQADGKLLVADVNGKGAWKNSPAAISIGNLNNANVVVTTATTALNIGAGNSVAFTKTSASSEVEISVFSNVSLGTFSNPSDAITFEIYVDGSPSTTASAKYAGFQSSAVQFVSIKSHFTNLAAGSHTIKIVAQMNLASSTNVIMDPGGFGGKIIIKELY